ncbi:MAG: OmpA family protein [Bacteroidota bacterium]
MKKYIVLFCLFVSTQMLFANNYRVEIAVFDSGVDLDYFYNIDDVKLAVDINDLFRYYLGDFDTAAEAETARKDVVAKGYKYAKVVDLKAERANCAMSCQTPLYVENLFFDFDKSFLRTKSKSDLDDLVTLMNDNPDYKVELSAHTDARGSIEYNTALSKRRSTAAKDYLIAKGISADRITTSEFGETSPIAKNNINGADSPSGRQYNRRVVVTVTNGKGVIVSNVVQPIDVPNRLKAN